jgi:protein ImuA
VQSLRCPAIGAVISRFERLTAAEYRSLQLAAQTGGGIGLLLLPASARASPSFAAVRLRVTPVASGHADRWIEIEVVRVRGGKAGESFVLEIDHETGDVRVPAGLASAASPARAS